MRAIDTGWHGQVADTGTHFINVYGGLHWTAGAEDPTEEFWTLLHDTAAALGEDFVVVGAQEMARLSRTFHDGQHTPTHDGQHTPTHTPRAAIARPAVVPEMTAQHTGAWMCLASFVRCQCTQSVCVSSMEHWSLVCNATAVLPVSPSGTGLSPLMHRCACEQWCVGVQGRRCSRACPRAGCGRCGRSKKSLPHPSLTSLMATRWMTSTGSTWCDCSAPDCMWVYVAIVSESNWVRV